jgi:hypothetical protein
MKGVSSSSAVLRSLLPALFALAAGCGGNASTEGSDPAPPSTAAAIAPAPAPDADLDACRARIDTLAGPDLPGAPAFDARRAEIFGRARGEPMVFVREPQPTPDDRLSPAQLASRRAFDKGTPGARLGRLLANHRRDPEGLRALVLREGYAYTPEPLDALDLVTAVHLTELFAEPEIWIQRGGDTRRLRRETKNRETTYRYLDGPLAGHAADLLFGDRVALREEELAAPLHRDLRALADVIGFDRAKIERRTEAGLVASLRFGTEWARALLPSHGASLELGCLAEDRAHRDAVAAARDAGGARRRALVRMHDTIAHELDEAFRFDRPEGEKSPDHDGEMRPVWASAYLSGRQSFEYLGTKLPVFDPAGNAWPPEVCVDFVLDTFERTSGSWFRPRGGALGREPGRLAFDETRKHNLRGVIAFGKFAEEEPELFDVRRFKGKERIEFRERSRYFQFLVDNADDVRPGDVVAIHGMKRDNRIHQHAILVEWADPITGFPGGLADQMKRPRRRTWEGIMAEAPLRSLLFRARPTDAVFAKLDPCAGTQLARCAEETPIAER